MATKINFVKLTDEQLVTRIAQAGETQLVCFQEYMARCRKEWQSSLTLNRVNRLTEKLASQANNVPSAKFFLDKIKANFAVFCGEYEDIATDTKGNPIYSLCEKPAFTYTAKTKNFTIMLPDRNSQEYQTWLANSKNKELADDILAIKIARKANKAPDADAILAYLNRFPDDIVKNAINKWQGERQTIAHKSNHNGKNKRVTAQA